jgi:hypothetical protein
MNFMGLYGSKTGRIVVLFAVVYATPKAGLFAADPIDPRSVLIA